MLRVQGAMREAYTIESEQKKETSEMDLKPLRYNPSLKCDPELEAMRPERLSKHTPIQTSDWKRYLIKTPSSYEGSFAEADIQQFRPDPTPSVMADPWYVSQLPSYGGDNITAIKMRNRRFQQSCAMEGANLGMRPQPMMMMGGPEDAMAVASMAYTDLQRQVNMLQTTPSAPIPPPRLNFEEDSLTVDMLPAPRKVIKAETKEVVAAPLPASSRGVGLGDQIAIRSYVLGKTL